MQPKRFISPEAAMLLKFFEKGIDKLTGLLNNEALQAKINELRHDTRKTAPQDVTFAYLDLDSIKSINDEYGHSEGDKHIKNFAVIFLTFFREHDYIYRINGSTGDEFGVLIESNQAELILKKLKEF